MKQTNNIIALLILALMSTATAAWAQQNPCNPCGPKNPCNPCNPCGGKAKNPCNPCGGKAAAMPVVNPCHAKFGTVFYIADPMGRNSISFTSEAPLEDTVGTTNQIVGYIVFDPNNPTKGGRGQLNIPTASLKTGIPLRDEHLRSADWLDAERYPQISFRIEDVKDVKMIKEARGSKTYQMKLLGSFTLHGKTKSIEVPARVTYMIESKQTREKLPGNLLAGRTSFDVPLKEFGIKGLEGLIGTKVSETINVKVSFIASSKNPAAKNPCNPCNPCGGKAKNPCNPCGGKKK